MKWILRVEPALCSATDQFLPYSQDEIDHLHFLFVPHPVNQVLETGKHQELLYRQNAWNDVQYFTNVEKLVTSNIACAHSQQHKRFSFLIGSNDVECFDIT